MVWTAIRLRSAHTASTFLSISRTVPRGSCTKAHFSPRRASGSGCVNCDPRMVGEQRRAMSDGHSEAMGMKGFLWITSSGMLQADANNRCTLHALPHPHLQIHDIQTASVLIGSRCVHRMKSPCMVISNQACMGDAWYVPSEGSPPELPSPGRTGTVPCLYTEGPAGTRCLTAPGSRLRVGCG